MLGNGRDGFDACEPRAAPSHASGDFRHLERDQRLVLDDEDFARHLTGDEARFLDQFLALVLADGIARAA